jgi:ketosteroid isomerase-like protein
MAFGRSTTPTTPTQAATVPPTGRSLAVLACDVIEIRDGKIYREREYMDTLSILQQLGAAPT